MRFSKGMSLVEILIAISILLAAMLPLYGLMGSSHKQATKSIEELRATQIAAEIIEQVSNKRWCPSSNLNDLVLCCGANTAGGGFEFFVSNFPEYMMLRASFKSKTLDCGNMVILTLEYSVEGSSTSPKKYTLGTFIED